MVMVRKYSVCNNKGNARIKKLQRHDSHDNADSEHVSRNSLRIVTMQDN